MNRRVFLKMLVVAPLVLAAASVKLPEVDSKTATHLKYRELMGKVTAEQTGKELLPSRMHEAFKARRNELRQGYVIDDNFIPEMDELRVWASNYLWRYLNSESVWVSPYYVGTEAKS